MLKQAWVLSLSLLVLEPLQKLGNSSSVFYNLKTAERKLPQKMFFHDKMERKNHQLLMAWVAKENQRQTERKLVCFWIMRKAVDGTQAMKETTVAWKDLIPGMLKLLAKVHQILLCLAFS